MHNKHICSLTSIIFTCQINGDKLCFCNIYTDTLNLSNFKSTLYIRSNKQLAIYQAELSTWCTTAAADIGSSPTYLQGRGCPTQSTPIDVLVFGEV